MFSARLQAAYLELIRLGKKTVEGRLFQPKYRDLTVGQIIRFHHEKRAEDYVDVQITKLTVYPSFAEMLQTEGLTACLPGIHRLEEAIAIYHAFPEYKEKESIFGVLSIGITVYDQSS